ncbi:MAG: MFS transporter [Desulfobacterales bacterium]|nr:MFS transporter [Desulfobacterales bacterium]MCP4161514.1 MFS transporter [Deltaproteobacteria bacterium]
MNNVNLNILLSGQLVSQIGDKLYMLALSFMVLESTGSSGKMGIVLFAGILPLVIVGLFAGVVVDRFNRKKIIIITDFLRGCITAVVSLLYYLEMLNFEAILISQILLGINSAFFNPVIPSVIPMIVAKDKLSSANAKTQFISGFSNIAGPAIGGILVATYGYLIVFILNALSYLVSALFECFLKIPQVKINKSESFIDGLKKGYGYIFSDIPLVIIIFMVFLVHFFVGAIEIAIPVISTLIPGKGSVNMGYLQTAFGTGAVLMAFILSLVNIMKKESELLFKGALLIGLLLILSGVAGVYTPGLLFYLFIFLLLSAFLIMAATGFQTLIQKRTSKEMTGRVFGVVSSIGNFSVPFSMLFYGYLMENYSLAKILIISGVFITLSCIASSILYKQRESTTTTHTTT